MVKYHYINLFNLEGKVIVPKNYKVKMSDRGYEAFRWKSSHGHGHSFRVTRPMHNFTSSEIPLGPAVIINNESEDVIHMAFYKLIEGHVNLDLDNIYVIHSQSLRLCLNGEFPLTNDKTLETYINDIRKATEPIAVLENDDGVGNVTLCALTEISSMTTIDRPSRFTVSFKLKNSKAPTSDIERLVYNINGLDYSILELATMNTPGSRFQIYRDIMEKFQNSIYTNTENLRAFMINRNAISVCEVICNDIHKALIGSLGIREGITDVDIHSMFFTGNTLFSELSGYSGWLSRYNGHSVYRKYDEICEKWEKKDNHDDKYNYKHMWFGPYEYMSFYGQVDIDLDKARLHQYI